MSAPPLNERKERWAGLSLEDLATPALLVDLDRLEKNLSSMAARATELGVTVRPHIKTHKTLEIARLQVAHGASGITVSTSFEARVFAEAGFEDILLAFPLQLSRLAELEELAARYRLQLVVDSRDALAAVEQFDCEPTIWLKVDCGYGRAGVDPAVSESTALARAISESPAVRWAGLLSHSGHAYDSADAGESAVTAEQERSVLAEFATRLRQAGVDVPAVSVGSTPATRAARDLAGVTEVRPGNYVFFDHTQVDLGSCREEDCALTVLSTVVSNRPSWSICDAGALALSKDPGAGRRVSFGEIYQDLSGEHLSSELRLTGLSQEHGKISRSLPVGKRLRILPNHSCLAVACFDDLYAVRGGRVVEVWRVYRGRC